MCERGRERGVCEGIERGVCVKEEEMCEDICCKEMWAWGGGGGWD